MKIRVPRASIFLSLYFGVYFKKNAILRKTRLLSAINLKKSLISFGGYKALCSNFVFAKLARKPLRACGIKACGEDALEASVKQSPLNIGDLESA